MKLFITASLVLLLSANSFSQEYMKIIASKSCDCLDGVTISSDAEQFSLELGLCMIEAAKPYSAELLRDHNIDFDKIDVQGEELGRLIGMKMATECPKKLMDVANKMSATEEETTSDLNTITGIVTNVNEGSFIEFSISDDSGTTAKYRWITRVESNVDLIERYNSLAGKQVEVTYSKQDIFDAGTGSYRSFRVITQLDIL